MPHLQRKSFATPDKVRTFSTGRIDVVTLGEIAIGRFVFRPGWRWSKDVAPIVGTRSCQHRHVGYTISGTLEVRMDDGTVRVFTGYRFGDELARHVAAADVFVFPSRTDTFGLVLLEAMACGIPVAAFPVTGPIDVVVNGVTGVLSEDLRAAALNALHLDRRACREHALRYTWEAATRQFVASLAPVDCPHAATIS